MIKFLDLSFQHGPISSDIIAAMLRVYESGIFLNGPEVEAFEAEWAAYCGQRYCVACASGTDALSLIVRVMQKPPIYVPANTTIFSQWGLERGSSAFGFGHIRTPIDVWPQTGWPNLWPEHSLPVLLYGRHLLPGGVPGSTVFDACQAHGWKPPQGINACWSFYPSKNLGCFGDGGALTTNDDVTARIFRNTAKYWHSRMSEINAAVLRTKLPHLDYWNALRQAVAAVYYNEMPDQVSFACPPGWPTNHHIFAILTDRRNELQAYLKENGVETKIHYEKPLDDRCRGARQWCNETLSLPCYPGLMPEQVQFICDSIRTFFRR